MGLKKGKLEYQKWEKGKDLTRKEAILAHCYQCNGFENGGVDCQGGKTCPLYQFMPYASPRAGERHFSRV